VPIKGIKELIASATPGRGPVSMDLLTAAVAGCFAVFRNGLKLSWFEAVTV
jgi:hypothetical protein